MPDKTFDPTEKAGLLALQAIANDQLQWICRPMHEADFGVDALLELTGTDLKVSGRLLGCQVKSGPSYFAQGSASAIYYYSNEEEIAYWRNYSLPVILVLHDPAAGETYWEDASKAFKTKKGLGRGWRIDVPRNQLLSGASRAALQALALAERRSEGDRTFDADASAPQHLVDAMRGGEGDKGPTQSVSASPPLAAHPTLTTADLNPDAALAELTLGQIISMARAPSLASPWSSPTVDRGGEDPVLHERITAYRDFDHDGAPDVALKKLQDLLPSVDVGVTPRAYFRIKVNIGSALMDLGRTAEASEAWEEASRVEPANPVGIAYLGMGQLLKGDYGEARRLAEYALAQQNPPATAVNVLLQALAYDPAWTGEPDDVIPPELRDTPDAHLGRIEFWRRRDHQRWAQAAIEAARRFAGEEAFKTTAAHAILMLAAPDGDPAAPPLRSIAREDLVAAGQVLQERVELWLRLEYRDDRELETYANNAAVCFRLAGEFGMARSLLGRVLSARSNLGLYKILGIVEALDGDRLAALASLAKAPEDGEARLFRAELLAKDDLKGALDAVLAVPPEIVAASHETTRWLMVASLALKLRDEANFQRALEAIRKDQSKKLAADIFEIEWDFGGRLAEEGARDRLRTLIPRLEADTTYATRYAFAEVLSQAGLYYEASECLEGFVDLDQPDPTTILYLECLALARRDKVFTSALRNVGARVRRHPALLAAAVAQAFNSGNFQAAEIEARALVSELPNRLSPRLLLWQVLARRDNKSGVRRLLQQDLETLEAEDATQSLKLARILFMEGERERALKLMYSLSWRHRDDRSILTATAIQILEAGRGANPLPGPMTSIGLDAAVVLTTELDEKLSFVIEPDPALRALDDQSWAPDHPIVLASMGREVGDTVDLADGETAVVSSIDHKYIQRMQRLLKTLPKRFPDNPGFRSVRVVPDAPGGFDNMFAIAKARADAVDEAFRHYAEGSMTLSMLALHLGDSPLAVLASMSPDGHKLINALGSIDERVVAQAALDNRSGGGAVIDLIAFWSLWRGGAMDAALELVGKVWVAASTQAQLEARRDELSDYTEEGLKQFGYFEGRPTLQETSASTIKAAIADLDAALAWLSANAEVHPVTIPDDLPDNLARAIQQLPVFLLDEIFIALERGALLVTDDQRLRALGGELGVSRAVWSQWLIHYAAQRKVLPWRAFVEASARMVLAGHAYVALSAQDLLEALRADMEDTGKPAWRYQALALCLGGPQAEAMSHLGIINLVITVLWRKPRFESVRMIATSILLRRLAVRRPDAAELFAWVAMRHRTNLELMEYMRGWVRGHFLGQGG